MKNWKYNLMTAALVLTAPTLWAATTTDSTQISNTELVEHHDFDDGSRHLTMSLGLDGMASNAKVKQDDTGGAGISAHANPSSVMEQ